MKGLGKLGIGVAVVTAAVAALARHGRAGRGDRELANVRRRPSA